MGEARGGCSHLLCPDQGGGKEKRGKARYRLVQALKAVIKLAAVMAHPGGLAPQHLHSTCQRRSLKPRCWLPKGRSVELSQLPCGPPATLFLRITSAIEERRIWEERAGRLANPPVREGREPRWWLSSSSSSSPSSSSSSSEGHLLSGNPQSWADELSPDHPAFDSGISLSRQPGCSGCGTVSVPPRRHA